MLITAIIIYFIFAFIVDFSWPIQLLQGRGGPLGYVVLVIWVGLLIGGLASL